MTDDEILVKFGGKLRDIRERRGLSAEKVGELMNLSADAVRKYERGDRELGIVRIVRVKNALNCNYMTMLSGLDDDYDDENKEFHILSTTSSQIMIHLATDWDGDIEALIIFMGLIAAFPEEERREIYMLGEIVKDRLLANRVITPDDLPPGMNYMENRLGELYTR